MPLKGNSTNSTCQGQFNIQPVRTIEKSFCGSDKKVPNYPQCKSTHFTLQVKALHSKCYLSKIIILETHRRFCI